MLTPRELVVVDADSEERDLIVRLIRRPSLGHMLNTLAESNLFFFLFCLFKVQTFQQHQLSKRQLREIMKK